MSIQSFDYNHFFEKLQSASVSLRRSEQDFLNLTASIACIQGDLVELELYDKELPEMAAIKSGAEAALSAWTGGVLYRVPALLSGLNRGGSISLKLVGEVKEQQRREYFRLDVMLPAVLTVPEDQDFRSLEALWQELRADTQKGTPPVLQPYEKGVKLVRWGGHSEVLPCRINLSGGGLSMRIPWYVKPGTQVALLLFIPAAIPRPISVIAEVLRCQELTLFWGKDHRFMSAMKFNLINEKDRDEVISFLFNEQRRELKMKKSTGR
ncbi:PilZ-like domain-containing protein [Geobacter sp. DSM 9736]|uniref:PilZ-like domain-containing protein n=1 Tax=Geobacter sp. DSM 9736 TaxID=1277350 RepID=UPI000B50986E|nr:PilZ-like domain-containing protein [Geobacter sp. DSM 9736]SNB47023.1 PilZ domain-containing protein [Geobacter sp. DSM 9736]